MAKANDKQLELNFDSPAEIPDIIIKEREQLFIPAKGISKSVVSKLKKKYSFYFFEEKACQQCEFSELRKQTGGLLPECETCAGFISGMELCKKVRVGNNDYYTAPYGDKEGLSNLLSKAGVSFDFKQYYKDHPIEPFSCTANLYDYQKQAIDAALKAKHGVICAPPRSGKTVIATALISKLAKKTIIIASQREWLNGFLETFIGSKTQSGFTDIDKSRIGFCKTEADADKYDICLATPQTFYSEKGMQLLRKIYNKFNVMVIDEVHFMPADRFSQTVSAFSCKYKYGLSGTPDRKDGKYILADNLIGSVLINLDVKRLVPQVRVVKTQYSKHIKGNAIWAYIVGPLERDKARQKLIAEYAIKDVKDGHIVLIPYSGVQAIKSQVEVINKLAGKKLAEAFYGGIKKEERDRIIQDARTRKLKIIVGNISLLSTGVNIPSASCLFDCSCTHNYPVARQRYSRVLTPCDDKPTPLIRIFLDDMDVRRNCLRGEFWQVLIKDFKADLSEKDMAAIKAYFNSKTSSFKLTMNTGDVF